MDKNDEAGGLGHARLAWGHQHPAAQCDSAAGIAVVVTGSHNFSKSVSSKNDENLLIIKGNKSLAQAYEVNILSVCDHYEFWDLGLAPVNVPLCLPVDGGLDIVSEQSHGLQPTQTAHGNAKRQSYKFLWLVKSGLPPCEGEIHVEPSAGLSR